MSLPEDITKIVSQALNEDVGSGDLSAQIIPEYSNHRAKVITREMAVLCGTAWFENVFMQLDTHVAVKWKAKDGEWINPDQVICEIDGPSRSILTGERTALNFLQTLSSTATITRRFTDSIRGTKTKILDTRKTIPGLRKAQKYAVLCGGGSNHRMGLYDALLLKENHIVAAGSITKAVQKARELSPDLKVEVEVENLDQVKEALEANADMILLDNMPLPLLRRAVTLATNNDILLEASGGISLNNIRTIAETGVDFISVGSLTKHIHAVDLSMRFVHNK